MSQHLFAKLGAVVTRRRCPLGLPVVRFGNIQQHIEDKHVIDVLLDVSEADDWKTQWATPTRNHSPELCKEMLTHQTVAGFSDGGAHTKFSHLGSFPTDLLTWMVRDTNTNRLEEAP